MKPKFTKDQVVARMKHDGLVPLFTTDDYDNAIHVVESAYFAGVRTFEFTNRRKNSFDVFVRVLEYCEQFPDLMLGIGTIMDGDTTEKFIDAGAHFIISPVIKLEMAAICHEHDIAWIPGCYTPTEIVSAKENGAAIIKLFPASALGPRFVESIIPVIPDVRLMITGGVEPTDENLRQWFLAGASCVGMGSQLFTKKIMDEKDWPALEEKISSTLSLIRRIRSR